MCLRYRPHDIVIRFTTQNKVPIILVARKIGGDIEYQ